MDASASDTDTITLFRPVGRKELELIRGLGNRGFPPRLWHQPIFYPVLSEDYARKIASTWNVKEEVAGYAGFVTRFRVKASYLARFAVQDVGGRALQEYWIPSEQLEEFNANIVGEIEVIAEYIGTPPATP